MPQVIWTPRALDDVKKLHWFISQKNKDAAGRAISAIKSYTRLLEDTPEIGVPDKGDFYAYRDLIIPFGSSGYVLRYRIDDDRAVILAVRHQKEAGFK